MSRQYDSVIYVKEFRDWFIRAFSVGCSDGFDAEDVTQLLKMDKVPGSDSIGGIFGVKVEEAIRLKFAHDKSLWMNKYRGLNLLVALNSTYNDLINSVDIVPTWVEMSKTTFVQSIGKMRHLIKTFRSICPDYFQNDAFLLLAQIYSTGKENFDEFKSALDLATAKKNIMWYEDTDLICEIYENMVNAESNAKEFINSFRVTPDRKRDRNDDQEKQARIGGKLKKKKKIFRKSSVLNVDSVVISSVIVHTNNRVLERRAAVVNRINVQLNYCVTLQTPANIENDKRNGGTAEKGAVFILSEDLICHAGD